MADRYFLIDCNNFYCSCERLFRPELEKRPVIVLSNNDGCFISRSDEVKHLGIPMGAPYFKYKNEVEKMGAVLFSANFSLYGDISARINNILRSYCAQMEIYSIDESFLFFKDIDDKHLTALAVEIRQKIKKWVGIPTSIGIGETKTLAKLANKIARNENPDNNGVYNFCTEQAVDKKLSSLPVSLIWGVGRQSALLLQANEIRTVLALRQANDAWLKQKMGIVGVRIATELRGISCLDLEEVRPRKKGITSSRSFGRPITTIQELKESIATYISRAAEKLRDDRCLASCIHVYTRTDKFKPNEYYNGHYSIPLPCPTAYTPELSAYALKALELIYVPNQKYKKAGVMLTGIIPNTENQLNLFMDPKNNKKQKQLMKAFDAINNRYGRHVMRFAAEGTTQLWGAKREQRSPSYTTEWDKLVTVG